MNDRYAHNPVVAANAALIRGCYLLQDDPINRLVVELAVSAETLQREVETLQAQLHGISQQEA